MHVSTKKWLFTKISSFILIPLMIWFVVNFVSIYENDYQSGNSFLSPATNKNFVFNIYCSSFLFFSFNNK
jgi:succinate dehydrogenase / fumarate reductase membrane anchor subunit